MCAVDFRSQPNSGDFEVPINSFAYKKKNTPPPPTKICSESFGHRRDLVKFFLVSKGGGPRSPPPLEADKFNISRGRRRAKDPRAPFDSPVLGAPTACWIGLLRVGYKSGPDIITKTLDDEV